MEHLQYYSNLAYSKQTLVEVLADASNFHEVPDTWHVVVVDVLNSTQAVADGRHHQINLTATGAIISVLNTVRKEKQNIEIPYFFGGDGATFLIPEQLLDKVITVLDNYSLHIKKNTKLILRVGQVSISSLNAESSNLKLAKHQLTKQLTIPIVLGNGLKNAEQHIKDTFIEKNVIHFKEDLLNLEGMECRWKQIDPSQTENKVICLLLDALHENEQSDIYRAILIKMNSLFGNFEERQPIKSEMLHLNYKMSTIWEEMNIRSAHKNAVYLIKKWFATLLGAFYLPFSKDGQHYLKSIGQLSHTFMLDGMINTIFTAENSKTEAFKTYLDTLESQQKIIYGMHVTHASVMSCYVLDRKTKHAHFVDGTEGGYTSAAKMFKAKLRAMKSS